MSLDTTGGKVVHFPANPDVFQFDADVAKIFPDMARRSIPMYLEAHRAHVAMLAKWIEKPACRVLDIGASRGQFFHALLDTYGQQSVHRGDLMLTAIDNSESMLKYMRDDFKGMPIGIHNVDVTSPEFAGWDDEQFEVVVMNYVLQFIPTDYQELVLTRVARLVAPGGVLILGQKDAFNSPIGEVAHEEYMEFRVRNGYSRDEIAAKTKALKGSMFPMNHWTLRGMLIREHFDIYETTRWMMFNTLFCVKDA